MATLARAATAYFLVVFFSGFIAGAVRVLFAAPSLGETAAILLELPLMLIVSWLACLWSVRRFAVPAGIGARASMGAIAFAQLMLAELAVARLIFHWSWAGFLTHYGTFDGLIGLGAQLEFAAFPVLEPVVAVQRHVVGGHASVSARVAHEEADPFVSRAPINARTPT